MNKIARFMYLTQLFVLLLITFTFSQTEISGPQSGTLGPGSYIVTGNISVQEGNTLIIEPGTEFKHKNGTKWDIYGELKAEGTADQKIKFLPDGTGGSVTWGGLKFNIGASDASIIDYCVFEYAQGNEWGGAIHIDLVDMTIKNSEFRHGKCVYYAPGIFAKNANVLVDHCLFEDNETGVDGYNGGGGMLLVDCLGAVVQNSIFRNNKCVGSTWVGCGGGGLACCYRYGYFITDSIAEAEYYAENRDTTTTIQYNLFYNNTAIGYGGAVQINGTTVPNFNNNTVVNNRCTASDGRGGGICTVTFGLRASTDVGYLRGVNNIIYNNSAPAEPQCGAYIVNNAGGYSFKYTCCSQDISGTGNITSDPQFTNAGSNDFSLLSTSPCIDVGDPASPDDPDGTRADMGALYYHQGTAIQPMNPTNKDNLQLVIQNNVQGNMSVCFELPRQNRIVLTLFNSQGQRIAELFNGIGLAGMNRVDFLQTNISKGTYFLNLQGENYQTSERFIIIQ